MTRNLAQTRSTLDLGSDGSVVEEPALLEDIQRGLADVEAGRVVPHGEARERLLARYRR